MQRLFRNYQCGEAVSKGHALYLDSSGNVYKALASDSSKMPAVGFADEDGTSSQYISVITGGFIENFGHGFAIGVDLYVSDATAGNLTTVVPAIGSYAQLFAQSHDSSTLMLNQGKFIDRNFQDNTMTVYFGDAGDVSDAYLAPVASSALASNNATFGLPRPIKIVGYFFEAAGRPAANSKVILREKTNLGTDKWSFTKPIGNEIVYGWNSAGFTTYSAGDRISVYIQDLTADNTQNPVLTLYYVWDD